MVPKITQIHRSTARLLVRLALVAGSSLTGVLLLESGLRATQTEAVEIEYEQKIHGVKTSISYTRDRWGLRSISTINVPKPPGVIRILCLGASTTDSANHNARDAWWGCLKSN